MNISEDFCKIKFHVFKINLLKYFTYIIIKNVLELNNTDNDNNLESIRSLYIHKLLIGLRKLNCGKIV